MYELKDFQLKPRWISICLASSVTMLNPNIPFNIMPLTNHSDKRRHTINNFAYVCTREEKCTVFNA